MLIDLAFLAPHTTTTYIPGILGWLLVLLEKPKMPLPV